MMFRVELNSDCTRIERETGHLRVRANERTVLIQSGLSDSPKAPEECKQSLSLPLEAARELHKMLGVAVAQFPSPPRG